MNDTCKLSKLVDRLQKFSSHLEQNRELIVHRRINHFYYMQKKEELLALTEQLEDEKKRLSWLTQFVETEYTSVFLQWRQDIRWFNTRQQIHQN